MRIQALIKRIIRQFLRDKRTLAMMIAAPLFILSLMYLVFNGGTYHPRLALVQVPPPLTAILQDQDARVTTYPSVEEAVQALKQRDADAVIQMNGSGTAGAPQVELEGSDPSRNRAVIMLLQSAMQKLQAKGGTAEASPTAPTFTYLHGSSTMTSFDHFGPVLIGVFSFFFVFLIAGVAFLKERTSGTLERLLASPLERWEIVVGYVAGFGIFTMLQAVLIVWYSIYVLGMVMAGSFGYVLLITLLLSMTALTLGTFLSAFAQTEFQMIQFIPIVITPQIFFCGLFDLDAMSPWLRWIANLMPLKYGADALRGIMLRGAGWSDIQGDIFLLLALSLVFMAANVWALKKHRRI